MAVFPKGVNIGTVSGGIVNFGGAVFISPISVTETSEGSGGGNTGTSVTTNTGVSSTNTLGSTKGQGSNGRGFMNGSGSNRAGASISGLSPASKNKISDIIDLLRTML